MLEMFYLRCYKISTYVVPFNYYHVQGVQGAISDIDNTPVPCDASADGQTVRLLERLRVMGIKACLLPDNKEPGVKPFADLVGSCYTHKASKPGVRGYKKAIELTRVGRNYTLFAGGQLSMDVCGANRAGIYSILVRPTNPRKEIQIVLKRYLGKPILCLYKRHARDISQDRG